jgi:adenosylcobinamide kinase/adenosylcobinamide-phosphate guanylyltransferase
MDASGFGSGQFMQNKTVLILGGARSGKSRHAQDIAATTGLEPMMIATAQPRDAEMAARIARHKADRDDRWRVIEEPINLVGALKASRAPGTVVLVDCLTLWLSNLMESGAGIVANTTALVDELSEQRGKVILVSNEVGFGIVPANELGRLFRDEQGSLNQAVARVCEDVIFMIAGLPLVLKPVKRG